MKTLIVLAWWFAFVSGAGAGRMIGPFPDRDACVAVRRAADVHVITTPCWSDGK